MHANSLSRELLAGLASLIAPPTCLACRAPIVRAAPFPEGLCADCRVDLEWIEVACRGCGHPRGPGLMESRRCVSCAKQSLGRVQTTTTLFRYRGAGRHLTRRLKYEGLHDLGLSLGRALGERLALARPEIADDDALIVVPVPLHPWRRLRRGFNQAHTLALGVAEVLERPIATLLRRRRATRALYGVRRGERDAVVEGAFSASDDARGARVLLVDDIRTSGATLRAAGRALRRGGARRIDAATVARG
jgi:ComF family protein